MGNSGSSPNEGLGVTACFGDRKLEIPPGFSQQIKHQTQEQATLISNAELFPENDAEFDLPILLNPRYDTSSKLKLKNFKAFFHAHSDLFRGNEIIENLLQHDIMNILVRVRKLLFHGILYLNKKSDDSSSNEQSQSKSLSLQRALRVFVNLQLLKLSVNDVKLLQMMYRCAVLFKSISQSDRDDLKQVFKLLSVIRTLFDTLDAAEATKTASTAANHSNHGKKYMSHILESVALRSALVCNLRSFFIRYELEVNELTTNEKSVSEIVEYYIDSNLLNVLISNSNEIRDIIITTDVKFKCYNNSETNNNRKKDLERLVNLFLQLNFVQYNLMDVTMLLDIFKYEKSQYPDRAQHLNFDIIIELLSLVQETYMYRLEKLNYNITVKHQDRINKALDVLRKLSVNAQQLHELDQAVNAPKSRNSIVSDRLRVLLNKDSLIDKADFDENMNSAFSPSLSPRSLDVDEVMNCNNNLIIRPEIRNEYLEIVQELAYNSCPNQRLSMRWWVFREKYNITDSEHKAVLEEMGLTEQVFELALSEKSGAGFCLVDTNEIDYSLEDVVSSSPNKSPSPSKFLCSPRSPTLSSQNNSNRSFEKTISQLEKNLFAVKTKSSVVKGKQCAIPSGKLIPNSHQGASIQHLYCDKNLMKAVVSNWLQAPTEIPTANHQSTYSH